VMSAPVFDIKTLLAGAEGGTVATYQARQVIFAQGDPADAIFLLMAGRVKRTVVSEEGKEAVVAILGPGDFFGEGCLSGKTHRASSGITMEECTIARVEKSVLVSLLHEETTFSEMFIAYLVKRNSRIEADLADQMVNPSEKRLARILLNLANFDEQEKAKVILPKISQEMLAEMVGTTRSRISFFMNKFRCLGFIDYWLHRHGNLDSYRVSAGRGNPVPCKKVHLKAAPLCNAQLA
jgi:CRP/FNR family transcriptional regulator, cyclic AMP receptor protein